ncbi:PcfR [Enterococcus faecalis]|uniref:PcfR n=4 Tax=Enterococcus faecalis TaxID=1351 RepID=UPI0020B1053B|nr:PcfR [Enterococcus faecalis]
MNLEKMKMEARKRMKILGIHEPTIAQFIEEGKISFSGKSYLGANYWINEERKKAIEIIEKENNILVYYAIEQKYMGDITMLYLFYISPYEEDWELDHQSIVENYQSVFVNIVVVFLFSTYQKAEPPYGRLASLSNRGRITFSPIG